MNDSEDYQKEVATRTFLISIFIIAVGVACILASLSSLNFIREHDYVRELLKELGIVLVAVFTVSLVYEQLLAEKHLKGFIAILQNQIERAEANAAACSELGIIRIFPNRSLMANSFPLSTLLCRPGPGNHSRFVALSLFHVMNNADYVKDSMRLTGSVGLCLLNPQLSAERLATVPDLEIGDIESALRVFKRNFVDWVITEKPPGRLELRYHDTPMPESFAYFETISPDQSLGVWDLSFGRDLKDKRVFVVDLRKRLGLDLKKRFDFIYNNGRVIFRYEERTIKDQ